jgi:hypothetical protein
VKINPGGKGMPNCANPSTQQDCLPIFRFANDVVNNGLMKGWSESHIPWHC